METMTVSEPAKGAGPVKASGKRWGSSQDARRTALLRQGPHGQVQGEKGAGGQRDDCRVGCHWREGETDVEKAGDSEVTLGDAWKVQTTSPSWDNVPECSQPLVIHSLSIIASPSALCPLCSCRKSPVGRGISFHIC